MPLDEQALKEQIALLGERLAGAVALNQKRAKYYREVDEALKPLDKTSIDTRALARKAMLRIEELERAVATARAQIQSLYDAAIASYAVMIADASEGGGGRDPGDPVLDLLRQELERLEPVLKAK